MTVNNNKKKNGYERKVSIRFKNGAMRIITDIIKKPISSELYLHKLVDNIFNKIKSRSIHLSSIYDDILIVDKYEIMEISVQKSDDVYELQELLSDENQNNKDNIEFDIQNDSSIDIKEIDSKSNENEEDVSIYDIEEDLLNNNEEIDIEKIDKESNDNSKDLINEIDDIISDINEKTKNKEEEVKVEKKKKKKKSNNKKSKNNTTQDIKKDHNPLLCKPKKRIPKKIELKVVEREPSLLPDIDGGLDNLNTPIDANTPLNKGANKKYVLVMDGREIDIDSIPLDSLLEMITQGRPISQLNSLEKEILQAYNLINPEELNNIQKG